jgi:hypothetical protein
MSAFDVAWTFLKESFEGIPTGPGESSLPWFADPQDEDYGATQRRLGSATLNPDWAARRRRMQRPGFALPSFDKERWPPDPSPDPPNPFKGEAKPEEETLAFLMQQLREEQGLPPEAPPVDA